ncbi:transcriptional regulator [Chryseobacterium sp. JV274]|uniref:transcriptional regulator n=1 Tax=Chryseobacterium sp. JV274 TaxID=1932669 RepID=UPI001E2C5A25|nr:transcriptional regulator [Chryseobacterium sp. JV274]
MELTKEGLAERSGAALSALRKYEPKEIISLDSFLKLLSVVLGLEELINSLEPNKTNFKTIDDVLKVDDNAVTRQRCKKND